MKKCKKACASNFLTEVKRITHKYGALLMFDENNLGDLDLALGALKN